MRSTVERYKGSIVNDTAPRVSLFGAREQLEDANLMMIQAGFTRELTRSGRCSCCRWLVDGDLADARKNLLFVICCFPETF